MMFSMSNTCLYHKECVRHCRWLRLHVLWPVQSLFGHGSDCRAQCRTHRSALLLSTCWTAWETRPLASLSKQRAWRNPTKHVYVSNSTTLQLSYNGNHNCFLPLLTLFMSSSQCLPGVEFPEAAVQVFQGSNEEPPAVNPHTGVIIEVRVQDEHWIQLLTVPQSSHQCWVIMQPESLAEPVNTSMSHAREPVNTSTTDIFEITLCLQKTF